jgi:hypothetical protein
MAEKPGRGGRRPGAGRKRNLEPTPVAVVSITLRGKLLEAVDAAAEAESKTRYRIVVDAVEEKFGQRQK